jgi:translocon-associated protein subunit alpha
MFLLNQQKPMVFTLNNQNIKLIFCVFLELIAGKLTRLLVGARNNGTQNYVVESIDGSLRYPQDFNYYIQNFTSLRSEKVVEPSLESTFEYLFMPSETFNGRPMGLVVLINYRNNVTMKIFI